MFQRTSTLVLMTLIIGANIVPADPGKQTRLIYPLKNGFEKIWLTLHPPIEKDEGHGRRELLMRATTSPSRFRPPD